MLRVLGLDVAKNAKAREVDDAGPKALLPLMEAFPLGLQLWGRTLPEIDLFRDPPCMRRCASFLA